MNSFSLKIPALIVLMVMAFACDNQSEDNQQQEEYLPDSTNTEGMVEADCFSQPDIICESGLDFVRLGDYVADVLLEELGDEDVQDSIQQGNGYEWLVRTLHLKDGKIIVEGEFFDQRESNDTLLSLSKVNRLRIESPVFHTPDQVRVGSTLDLLNQKYSPDSLLVSSIPEYQVINVQVYGQRINYHISDQGNQIATAAGNNLSIGDIPADKKISAIVIM